MTLLGSFSGSPHLQTKGRSHDRPPVGFLRFSADCTAWLGWNLALSHFSCQLCLLQFSVLIEGNLIAGRSFQHEWTNPQIATQKIPLGEITVSREEKRHVCDIRMNSTRKELKSNKKNLGNENFWREEAESEDFKKKNRARIRPRYPRGTLQNLRE